MRLVEFFEDSDGHLSMSRLLSFMSFFPASSVLAVIHTEVALGIYLTAYAAQYVTSKRADALMKKVNNAIPAKLPKR